MLTEEEYEKKSKERSEEYEKYEKERSEWAKKELKELHTRQLMYYLKHSRACGNWYSPCCSESSFGFTFDEIKEELNTREHIPNKREARKIRQEKAKRK